MNTPIQNPTKEPADTTVSAIFRGSDADMDALASALSVPGVKVERWWERQHSIGAADRSVIPDLIPGAGKPEAKEAAQ